MENKQEILDLLLPALQATDLFDDLEDLQYNSKKEVVYATFRNGAIKAVNVAADSGASMVLDVVRQLSY